jgi:pyruvate/2-oxoglutarate dehydrogenase complex dihydrolipoamide acyltransferase (E2) component
MMTTMTTMTTTTTTTTSDRVCDLGDCDYYAYDEDDCDYDCDYDCDEDDCDYEDDCDDDFSRDVRMMDDEAYDLYIEEKRREAVFGLYVRRLPTLGVEYIEQLKSNTRIDALIAAEEAAQTAAADAQVVADAQAAAAARVAARVAAQVAAQVAQATAAAARAAQVAAAAARAAQVAAAAAARVKKAPREGVVDDVAPRVDRRAQFVKRMSRSTLVECRFGHWCRNRLSKCTFLHPGETRESWTSRIMTSDERLFA